MKKSLPKSENIKPDILEEDILSLNKVIGKLEKSDLTEKNLEYILKAATKLEKKIDNKYGSISSNKNLDSKK